MKAEAILETARRIKAAGEEIQRLEAAIGWLKAHYSGDNPGENLGVSVHLNWASAVSGAKQAEIVLQHYILRHWGEIHRNALKEAEVRLEDLFIKYAEQGAGNE